MIHRSLPFWLAVLVWALPSSLVAAELAGSIKDASGAPLLGVSIVLRSPATGSERLVRSGADGAFVFRDLPDGAYELVASFAGLARFQSGLVSLLTPTVRT